MFFIDRKRLRFAYMSLFKSLPEFQKEFEKLKKKYPSLEDDIKKFEAILVQYPLGIGTNFAVLYRSQKLHIIKSRLACKSLRDRSIRVVYSYHQDTLTFLYIEIYFKGDKENENTVRINNYIKSFLS